MKIIVECDDFLQIKFESTDINESVSLDIFVEKNGTKFIGDNRVYSKEQNINLTEKTRGCLIATSTFFSEFIVNQHTTFECCRMIISKSTLQKILSNSTIAENTLLNVFITNETFYHYIPQDLKVSEIFTLLLNYTEVGFVNFLFLKSKTLELFYLILKRLNDLLQVKNSGSKINYFDLTEIFNLEKEITKDITSPIPTIESLSAMVGMSSSKFKTIFKDIYGESVHSYVISYRFNVVKEKIERKEITATQAGRILGYSNLTFFARVFKRKFGVFPSEI